MKSELYFSGGKLYLKVTNTITGESKSFGPFTFEEGESLLRDSDKCRDLFLYQ